MLDSKGSMKPNSPYSTQADAMARTAPVTRPDPSDYQAKPAAEAPPIPMRDRFAGWLKSLAIYLGAVALACATGIFFLWQLPFLQDLPEWIKSVSDASPSRLAPPTLVAGGSPVSAPPEPPAPTVPPEPPAPTASPETPLAQTGAIVVHAQPPETPADVGSPPVTPEQTTAPAQTDPAAAPPAAPVEPIPALTAQQQEIQQLLADARLQMEDRRFTSPPSGNALLSYQRILELEPSNPVATEGVQRITTYYQDIARQSLLEGRTDESLAYINRGLRAAPNNPALLNLRREARSAKQREEQQRQSLLEERRRKEAELQARRQEAEPAREISRQPPPVERPSPWWQRQQQQPPAYNESGFNQR